MAEPEGIDPRTAIKHVCYEDKTSRARFLSINQ
jgi:hypothetical protein